MTTHSLKYEYSEPNECVNRMSNGYCIKTAMHCPDIIKYDRNNSNNAPCDLAGYKTAEKYDHAEPDIPDNNET